MKNMWLNKEYITTAVLNSKTYAMLLRHLGLTLNATNYNTAKKYITKYGISVDHFQSHYQQALERSSRRLIPNDKMFIEHSTVNRNSVKKRIIEHQLIEYKCRDCNNDGLWNNKRLVLQLEHCNGINTDNRLENLCFLCPNCHTQTSTYAGKNATKTTQKQSRSREQYNKYVVEQNKIINAPLIERITHSNIDFSKHGWVQQVAKLINKHPQKVNGWMKTYMLDFYNMHCYKRNNRLRSG